MTSSVAKTHGSQYDQNHMNQTILPHALSELLTEELREVAVGALYRKAEHLFSAGAVPQWMFYVVRGEVALERPGAHGEQIILLRSRSGFVSEASLLVEAYHCYAMAIEETQVIKLLIPALRAALKNDRQFASRWIHTLNSEIMRLRMHCERLSFHSVQERLLHLIRSEGNKGRYAIPTGIKTLAGELGVSHEALYRTVADLKRQGLLERTESELVLVRESPS
jgi:CRP/FNR family transcriptional regulator, dissimilatory nitrate respiration regulator